MLRITCARGLGHIDLEFFSPYCPHCVNMMPKVEQLYEKYGDEVAFIMVSHGEEGVSGVKERYNLTLVILVDLDGKMFDKYGVWGVPTFFVPDREHRIVRSEAGEMDVGGLNRLSETYYKVRIIPHTMPS